MNRLHALYVNGTTSGCKVLNKRLYKIKRKYKISITQMWVQSRVWPWRTSRHCNYIGNPLICKEYLFLRRVLFKSLRKVTSIWIINKMPVCDLHNTEAVCRCLLHGELMCDECKYDKRHKDCPKDTVSVSAGISAEDLHRKEAHNVCCEIYTTALKIRNGNLSHENDQSAKEVKSNLRVVLKEF